MVWSQESVQFVPAWYTDRRGQVTSQGLFEQSKVSLVSVVVVDPVSVPVAGGVPGSWADATLKDNSRDIATAAQISSLHISTDQWSLFWVLEESDLL